MHPNRLVANAASEAVTLVRGVQPAQLDAPTPCHAWDVHALVNHLFQVIHALGLAGRGGPVPDDVWAQEMPSTDRAQRFDEAARHAVAAWTEPAATDRTVRMGTMEMPAAFVATMLASDLVIHGWDLARATGQDFGCADGDAEAVHRFVQETGELGRRLKIFAEPVPVGGGAGSLDRTLALSGRDPGWSPAQ